MDFQKIKSFLKSNYIIILILITSLIIRIYYISPIITWDESIYSNLGHDLSKNLLSYSFKDKGWSDFIPCGNNLNYCWPKAGFRAPLLPYLIAVFYFIKLESLLAYLLPIIGTLNILLVYILGKSIFNKKVGIYAALLFGFLPLNIYYSTKILTDELFIFLVILSFLFFWKGYEKNNNAYKVIFGASLALALLSRYTLIWFIPVFFFYLLIRNKSLKFLKDEYLQYSILLFIILITPWLIYGWFSYGNPLGPFIHGQEASSYWGGSSPWYFFFEYSWKILSIAGPLFIATLLFLFYKKELKKKEFYFLILWIVIFFLMSFTSIHKEERYLLPIVPAICLICGLFLSKLKRPYPILIICFCIIILLASSISYMGNLKKIDSNINSQCFIEINNYLKNITGNFVTISENPPLLYYYTYRGGAYYPDPITEKSLNLSSSRNVTIYFVFTRLNSGFESEKFSIFKDILNKSYKKVFACPIDPEFNFIYSKNNPGYAV